MRKNETVKTEATRVTTQSTYTTDSFRKIKDKDTGVVTVKRWVEEHSIGATLVAALGGVFHNGARIA